MICGYANCPWNGQTALPQPGNCPVCTPPTCQTNQTGGTDHVIEGLQARVAELEAENRSFSAQISLEPLAPGNYSRTLDVYRETSQKFLKRAEAAEARVVELRVVLAVRDAERDKLQARVVELKAILAVMVDKERCRFDHHGTCQTHFGTTEDGKCAVAVARAALEKDDE
tara:strand:- start:11062 stop:11571 length:510 start_codon:yes stop_codon:yes gene_type:complete